VRAESALMYIKSILLLSLKHSDIPGGVVVSTTDYEATDRRFETHLGHDFFFFHDITVVALHNRPVMISLFHYLTVLLVK
jgi:hypothetical protein